MFVCATVSELRFYVCCNPCFLVNRASVEEAERQAKAVLNAADSTATEAVDDSATLNDDLTEEAAAPAAEIQKVVQDLDKDAEGSFQVKKLNHFLTLL